MSSKRCEFCLEALSDCVCPLPERDDFDPDFDENDAGDYSDWADLDEGW